MDEIMKHSIIFTAPAKHDSSSTRQLHAPVAFFLTSILRPKVIVELGVHTGHSYNAFCQAVKELKMDARCFGINTWKGDIHSDLYGEDVFKELSRYNQDQYGGFSQLMRMNTFDEALADFADQSIDLLHIDGLHTYEAAKHDFEAWLPKMRPYGVVVFHDTEVTEPGFGVWRLWEELSQRYPNCNFEHGFGLWMIAVGSSFKEEFLTFLNQAKKDGFSENLFLALGKIIELESSLRDMQNTVTENNANLNETNAKLLETKALLESIYQSNGWRLLQIYYKLRQFLSWGIRRRILRFFGLMHWPAGEPEISQGFKGEELQIPGVNLDNPMISIVMPVYNACRSDKKHFIKALESVANQTYKNIELIIVDDGSTDDSRIVCESFLSTRPDLRIQYLTKANGGQSSARNFGIKACNSEYIGFIDQDDEWYKNKLEKVVPWLVDKNIDVLYTDADIIDNDGNIIHEKIHQSLFVGWPHPKKVIEDILFKDVFVMPGLMTIKKETLEKVGGFDENLSGYEDDDLFLRMFEKSKIFYLPVPTLRWRMYEDNYSFSHRMLASRTSYWRKLLKNYTDNGTNQFREHMISLRFFWEFIYRALDQYDTGNELYGKSIDGAREIVPHLPKHLMLLFNCVFLLPLRYTMLILVLTRKARYAFR
jgi:glycosyltransferase involved in cell wall biosynthesis